jgi:hypothetical protein
MWNKIEQMWCRMMHEQTMWPMHGKYTCGKCLREYPVAWEGRAARDRAVHETAVSLDVVVLR